MAEVAPNIAATHPRFMGMRGRPLDLMVSVIATTGFLLFGYDRKRSHALHDSHMLIVTQRVLCPALYPQNHS